MTGPIPGHDLPGVNRQMVLVRRPSGNPVAGDFARRDAPVPRPAESGVLVRNLYLSADPAQRGWSANPQTTPLDAPMRALAVGIALESQLPDIRPGDLLYGFFGWQDYATPARNDILSVIRSPRLPASAYAGVAGMPGITAWIALNDLAPPSPGQTILVSTAAGAVGSVVGQLARQAGAHAIGLAGSDEKVARCTAAFGYAAAFNYRRVDLAATLAAVAPGGFNTYFDNTGGVILDTAIRAMAKYGRIIQCGMASVSNWNPPPAGLRNEREILFRVLTWSGFFIFDHVARFGATIDRLTDLVIEGGLAYEEDIDTGFDTVGSALEALFSGANHGKKLVFIGRD